MNKELLKGTTELLILKILKDEDLYGYGIIKKISLISKGTFEFKEGTLYPILHALEKKKYIKSYWEKPDGERKRKYYQITTKGSKELATKEEEWLNFSSLVNMVLDS